MGGIVLPNGYLYESGNSYICAVTFEQIQNVYIFGAIGITWVLYLIIVVHLIVQVFYDFLTWKIAIEMRKIFIVWPEDVMLTFRTEIYLLATN